MKRKLFYGIASVLLLTALATMIAFAFGGGETPAADGSISFEGTWRVVVYTKGNESTIIENEYMVFEGDRVSDYRDGSAEPAVSAAFTVSGDKVRIPDLSRTYTVEKKSDNIWRFCESYDAYMDLVKWPDNGRAEIDASGVDLTGKWMITFRVTEKPYEGDSLVFENGKVSQYLAGKNDPVATGVYEVEQGHLLIAAWNKDLKILPISEDTVILIELTDYHGYIWELTKAE